MVDFNVLSGQFRAVHKVEVESAAFANDPMNTKGFLSILDTALIRDVQDVALSALWIGDELLALTVSHFLRQQ